MAAKADVDTHLNDRRDAIGSTLHDWADLRLSADDRADIIDRYFKEADLGETFRVGNGASVHVPLTSFNPDRSNLLVVGRHGIAGLAARADATVANTSMTGPGVASQLGPTMAFCEGMLAARALLDEAPLNVSFLSLGDEDTFASVGGADLINPEAHDAAPSEHPSAVILTNAVAWTPQQPTVTTGARGQLTVRLSLTSGEPITDYITSGALRNPLTTMTQLLGSLRNDKGRIAVPGFYGRAVPPSESMRSALTADDHDGDAWAHNLGRPLPAGKLGALERATLWPGVSVLGIETDSYDGLRSPGTVTATVTFYLVPDQRPAEVATAVQAWFEDSAPPDAQPSMHIVRAARPYLAAEDCHVIAAQSRAAYRLYGRYPIKVPAGGPPGAGEVCFAAGVSIGFAGIAPPGPATLSLDERLARVDFDAGVSIAAETCLQLRRA